MTGLQGHFAAGSMVGLQGHFALSAVSKAITRYFTSLDSTLAQYYRLAKPIVFTGDFETEIELVRGVSLHSVSSDTGGSLERLLVFYDNNDVELSGVKWGSALSAIQQGEMFKLKLVRTGSLIQLIISGVSKGAKTRQGDVIFNVIGAFYNLVSFFYNDTLATPKFTDLADPQNPIVTEWTLGNAPVDDLYTFGGELWGNPPTRLTGSWVDNGDNSYTKTTPTSGDCGLLYIDINAPKPNTTYFVTFDVDVTASSGLNLFTRGASSNNITVATNLATGSHALTVTTGSGGGLWFSKNIFTGTVSDVSIREITNYDHVQAGRNIEYSKGTTFGANTLVAFTSIQADWVDNLDGSYTRISGASNTEVNHLDTAYSVGDAVEVSVEITELTSGGFKVRVKGGEDVILPLSVGLHTVICIAGNSGSTRIRSTSSISNGTVRLISIREIQGNALTAVNTTENQPKKHELSADETQWVATDPATIPQIIEIA